MENDNRKSGEKIFDYVDPKNRAVQIEMEQACTQHLKDIGGYLKPEFKSIEFSDDSFEFEASVIIPCKNRVKTIELFRDRIQALVPKARIVIGHGQMPKEELENPGWVSNQ